MNSSYKGPADLPEIIPVFPLAGALLLPRGQMPLNIFEPRYLAMVDAALAGTRVIGMIQPQADFGGDAPRLYSVGCAGRLVQFAETGDGRYLVSLTGISRFLVVSERSSDTPFRQARVSFEPYADDFVPASGEEAVDRAGVLSTLKRFADANSIRMDWDEIEGTRNEALVNALAMMAPFGPREKQALLETPDLRTRAETLVALTEIELARTGSGPQTTLQ